MKPKKSDDAEVDRLTQTRDVLMFKVLTAGPDEPIRDVAQLVPGHQIRIVPVINCDGRATGTVSEGNRIGRGSRTGGSTRACCAVERLH
jgi:CBS domain-containing protein